MQHLEVSGAVRPLQSSLGVKGLMKDNELGSYCIGTTFLLTTKAVHFLVGNRTYLSRCYKSSSESVCVSIQKITVICFVDAAY